MTPPEPEDAARPDTRPDDATVPEAAAPLPAGDPAPAGRGRAELPDDVDAAFAAIVASWAASDAPRWPDGGEPGTEGVGRVRPDAGEPSPGELSSGVGLATPPEGRPALPPTGPTRAPDADAGPTLPPAPGTPRAGAAASKEPDEHFVPPEPPPLPRLGMSSLLGLLLLVVGVVLLAVPGLVGGSVGVGIVPGLLAMTAGLGWLVFGMRRSSEHEDGPDHDGVL